MDDKKDELKTPAEMEQEARERVRAEINKAIPDDKPSAGQPIVVKHQKPKSKRTLFVCVFSLLALIGLAIGADYASGLLKKGEEEETDGRQTSDRANLGRERQNMGRDVNALTTANDTTDKSDNTSEESEEKEQEEYTPPPPPPSFNKASALAENGQKTAGMNNTNQQNSPASGNTPVKAEVETENNVVSVTGVKQLKLDPNLFVPVDRYIPCSMMRRFVSDIAGNISCLISQDVYSANNHVKLIPAGTVARGTYRSGTLKHGQGRMFIAWTELRTPDHLIIPLVDTQATGQLGENGVAGWVDSHFLERFGNAMMLSVVDDVAAAAADNVPSHDGDTDYTENSREALADMAKIALENSINIPPTMYLNQGDVISIMTGSDIDFSGIYKLRLKSQ